MAKVYFFRYQLLPVLDEEYQTFLDFEVSERKKVIDNKNLSFAKAMESLSTEVSIVRSKHNRKITRIGEHCYFIKIGQHKPVPIEHKDFTKETADSWPSVSLYVDNDPSVQIIAVEENIKAFSSYVSPVRILRGLLSDRLKSFNTEIYIKQMFYPGSFWELVETYKTEIAAIRFLLITPNMSNISKTLTEDLKTMTKSIDAHETRMEMVAHSGQHLQLDHDPTVAGIVDYAANGGGIAKIRLRGYKKYQTGGNDPLYFSIEELDVETWKEGELQAIVDNLMGGEKNDER